MNKFKLFRISSPRLRNLSYTSVKMGRENILHYQLEHDKETDLPTEINVKIAKTSIKNDNFPFSLLRESTIKDYLENNRFFVDSINHAHSREIFNMNGKGQSPHTLWIGCSDSRCSESCLSVLPGEVFTHRNIANIVNSNDISSQGIIQFAIDVLKIKKVIVCGHYDCGGVWASMSSKKIGGVLDHWLNPIRQIRANNKSLLQGIDDPKERANKLVELNVIESVLNLKRHPSASVALKNGDIEVWGMIYDVSTGYLHEVEIPTDDHEDMFHVHDEGELVH